MENRVLFGLASAAARVISCSISNEICMRELIAAMRNYEQHAARVVGQSNRAFNLNALASKHEDSKMKLNSLIELIQSDIEDRCKPDA